MSILVRLARYAWHYRLAMVAAWGSLLAATALQVAVPRLLGTSIDEALAFGTTGRLWVLAGSIVLVTLLRGGFSYAQSYLGEAISQHTAYGLRDAFYEKLQRLSFAFHDREHTGDLMSKGTVDVETVRAFISVGLIRSLHMVLLVIFAAILMITMDWQLGLVSLAFVPIIAFRGIIIARQMRYYWTIVHRERGLMTTVLQENLTGMRVVKAFGAEEYEKAKFGERIEQIYHYSYDAQRVRAAGSSSMQFFFLVATGTILWLGGHAVVDGRLTPGEMAQFILYIGMLTQPVRMVGFLVDSIARAIAAGERIFAVLDAESPVQERPDARPLARVQGHVAFEGVTFAYALQPTVRQVSLEARAGQVVALLGSPGSGKTTLVHLLARFYDVDEGRITIDGTDIRDVTLESLRQTVGVVQQDVFLFSATVRDNIAYGKLSATMSEVVEAAQTAQLHEEILEMPEGYDTLIGERGVTLSGGQRQRLAIARTLLLAPPVLVLDDSTSSVDAATEALIQKAMANVMKGRTTFIVAHRLTSIQHAHLVVVLEHGQIVEMGSPQELLDRDSLYRHIAELQGASPAAEPDLTAAPVQGPARGGS